MKNIICCFRSCSFYQNRILADVTGSLPKYFDRKKYDVRIILPKYLCMDEMF